MSNFSASIEFKFSSNFRKVAKGISKSTKMLTDDFKKLTSAVSANEKGFKDLNDFFKRGFLIGLAALTGAFAIATVKAQEYNKAIAQLSAITGLAGKELENFGKQSIEASNRFGVAAAGYLEAVQLVASAKPELLEQPALLKDITDQAAILAKAAGIDLASAATSLTDAMNQFGLSAKEANRAINVLAAGSKFGASLVGDTAQALVKAGVAAKAAGASFEETNAIIQVLAQRGIKGAMAGTQMRGIFIRLAAVMDQLGASTPTEALEKLAAANLSAAEITKAFGQENFTAASILIESTKQIRSMTEAVTDTNIASEQARTNMKAFGERMSRLKQVVLNSIMVAFEPLVGVLGIVAEVVAKVLRVVIKFPVILYGIVAAAKALVIALGAITAVMTSNILVATGAAAAFTSAAASVWTFTAALVTNPIGMMSTAITFLIGKLVILKAGLLVAAKGVWAFTVALLANPIGAIVAGVVALVAALALLIAKWDNLRKLVFAINDAYMTFYKGVFKGIMQVLIPAWEEFMEVVGEAAAPFKELFTVFDETFQGLAEMLGVTADEMGMIAKIGKFVGKVIGLALRGLLTPLRLLLTGFAMLVDAIKLVGNVLTGNFGAAWESLKSFFMRAMKLIDPFIDQIQAVAEVFGLLGFGEEPKAVEAATQSASASAAATTAAAAVSKQQLDVNLKVDSEGRVKVEKIKSDKAINTAIESGPMIPEGV